MPVILRRKPKDLGEEPKKDPSAAPQDNKLTTIQDGRLTTIQDNRQLSGRRSSRVFSSLNYHL